MTLRPDLSGLKHFFAPAEHVPAPSMRLDVDMLREPLAQHEETHHARAKHVS